VPATPEYLPVPLMNVPRILLLLAVPSPRSSLKTRSPCSSVQTARPTMPVALSLNTIASDRKPTPGRDRPASTSDPSRVAIVARRSAPNPMPLRLPAAVHVPWNSIHAPAADAEFEGCGARAQPVIRASITNEVRLTAENIRESVRCAAQGVAFEALIAMIESIPEQP